MVLEAFKYTEADNFLKNKDVDAAKKFKPNDLSKYYNNQDQVDMSFDEFEQLNDDPKKMLEKALNDLSNTMIPLKKDDKYLYLDYVQNIQDMLNNPYLSEEMIKYLIPLTQDINTYFATKINKGLIINLDQDKLDDFFKTDKDIAEFQKKLDVVTDSLKEKEYEVKAKERNNQLSNIQNIDSREPKESDIFLYVSDIKKGFISQENQNKIIQKVSVMKFNNPYMGILSVASVLSLNLDQNLQIQLINNNVHLIKTADNFITFGKGLVNKDVWNRFKAEYLQKNENLFMLYIDDRASNASMSIYMMKTAADKETSEGIKPVLLDDAKRIEETTKSFIENAKFSDEDNMIKIIQIIDKYGERMVNPKEDIISILNKNTEIKVKKEKNINKLLEIKQKYGIN